MTHFRSRYRRYHDTWSIDSDTYPSVCRSITSVAPSWRAGRSCHHADGSLLLSAKLHGNADLLHRATSDCFLDSNSGTGRLEVTPKSGIFGMPAGTTLTLQYDGIARLPAFEAPASSEAASGLL